MAVRALRRGVIRKFSPPLASFSSSSPSLSSSVAWPTVAIVGVGQMGAAIAGNLLRHEVPLILYDRQKDKGVPVALRDSLARATWATSAKEAVSGASVVITALPKPEDVSSAFESEGGILEGLQKGTTWVEHSTTDFENTLRIKDKVEALGCAAVEAPLTGGMQVLREGRMVTLVGAKPEDFEGDIARLVALSAPRIVRCGEFGHATIVKLFSNMLCATMDCAVGEALCVARKAGMDMKLVFDAMRVSSGNSFMWETEVPLVLRGEYDPNFTAEMMAKDISLGLDLGARYGVPQPFNAAVLARYREAIETFGPGQGSTIPVRLNELESGVSLSSDDIGISDANNASASGPPPLPGTPLADPPPPSGENHASSGRVAAAAFEPWSYTTEIADGSFQVVHQDYDNPYLKEPFTTHADL